MTASPDYVNAAFVRLAEAFAWPARVLEERETRARLAALSEREWRDIGVRPDSAAKLEETADERRTRAVAVRAWHHAAKAA